jgi:PAS domain S-box-containing protein
VLESEALRGALAALEASRRRESVALQDSITLFAALEALSGRPDASAALQALLECLRLRYDIPTACYVQAEAGALRVLAAAATSQIGLRLPIAPALLDRPRRIGRLARVPADAPLPHGFADLEAAILVMVPTPNELPGGLFLGTDQPGRFSPGDLRLLERIGRMAGQSLTALREVRRNALLVSLIEGRAPAPGGGALDAPLEAVHRAFTRLTEAQGHVVGIQDALLGAPLDCADAAIDDALARTGTLTDMDRVYVFRLRPDAALIDNTHEWCAPGIAAMRATLQGIPADMIAPWRTAFAETGKVVIPDVAAMPDRAPEKQTLLDQGIRSLLAVPLEQDGVFQGFVGYDAVRGLRRFLPGEVHLIRSVAKVIAAILWRRDAEADRDALANDLQAVITAMPGVLIRIREMDDGSWRRIYVGPGIEDVTGYSVDEALRPEWHNENLPPAEKGLLNAQVPWFSEHQVAVEFRFRHKKGHWIWIRRTARSHVASDGRRETIAVWNDVTREKSLSEQLAQSAKLAQLGEVATGMAHELNQPLAGISMAAENAQRSLARLPEPPQRALEKLGLIVDLTKRASDIIDHMRVFGRSDTASRGPVSVAEVVKGAGQLLASKLLAGSVRLQPDLPEGLPPVLGKAVPLEQVIMNLISNACDAYVGLREPVPTERRVISVTAHVDADWVTIQVQDAAGGIPGEVLPRIFEPFFTTKPVGQGTGLGLSISYGIITDMGGTITAENHADGCLLRILLPVAR